MSDSKLRELERRWRETKSVDDEAAYLRERVRVGDLTQERLELAAYCGHEGARRLTSVASSKTLDDLCWSLTSYDQTYGVRVAVFATEVAVEEWQRLRGPADARLARALSAAATWTNCPCEEHAALAETGSVDAADAALDAQEADEAGEDSARLACELAMAARDAADAITSGRDRSQAALSIAQSVLRQLVGPQGPMFLDAETRRRLISWLLGAR